MITLSRPGPLLLLALTLSPGAAAAPRKPADSGGPGARLVVRSWYRKVELAADRERLGRHFARAKYHVPDGSYLFAARVIRGLSQPAFVYYSLGDSGFVYSADTFWVASTVKLMATVGALWTLSELGLDGSTWIEMEDDDGRYAGTVRRLYDRALRLSKNVEYNRLMLIAGYDAINDRYMTERWGMPTMVLQRRYARKIPGANLRRSPTIHYRRGQRRGELPARQATASHTECPREGNCATLAELQEGLRRVVLQRELPPSARFPIALADWRRIMRALSRSHKKLVEAATAALKHPVTIYNKAGRYPGDDHLDNALIVDRKTRRRFLLTLSAKYKSLREPDAVTAAHLTAMGRLTLESLERARGGVPLQLDAGAPIAVSIERRGGERRFRLRLTTPAKATRFRVWLDSSRPLHLRTRRRVGAIKHQRFATLDHHFREAGEHLLVIQALRGRRRIGYRATVIQVD